MQSNHCVCFQIYSNKIGTVLQTRKSQAFLSHTLSRAIVTARIRSMTGRYCFHRCLSVNISGWGGSTWSQIFGGGGTWSQIFGGGYLVSDFRGGVGYLVSDFQGGVPGLRFLGGLPGLRFLGGVGYLVSDFRGGVPGLRFSGGVPGLRFLRGGTQS